VEDGLLEKWYSIRIPFLGVDYEILLKLTDLQYGKWLAEEFDIVPYFERSNEEWDTMIKDPEKTMAVMKEEYMRWREFYAIG